MIFSHFLPFCMAFTGGLALGVLYLGLLRASVRCFLDGTQVGFGILTTIARMVVVGAGLWISVQFGAGPLIGCLAGFTVMRVLGTRKRAFSWT